MSWIAAIPIIGDLLKEVFGVIDQIVVDKDQRERLKAGITSLDLTAYIKEIKASAQTVITEATGRSWLQRNWRPLVMLMFAYMICHNFIIVPIVRWIDPSFPEVIIPEQAWIAIGFGLGGYGIGRSAEKIVAMFSNRRK